MTFLARQTSAADDRRQGSGKMDAKIYVLMLLIGALVALYHAANPEKVPEQKSS